jgi:hypothetical protein
MTGKPLDFENVTIVNSDAPEGDGEEPKDEVAS